MSFFRILFRCAPRARVFFLTRVLVCLTLAFTTSAQDSVSNEFRSKANFLANFPSFVDWPDSAFSSPEAPLTICISGEFRFGTVLAQIARSASPHGRRIEIKWIHNDQQLRPCQIIFVSRSEAKRYTKLLLAIDRSSALTVGETPDFLDAGGMITFDFEREVLQFEVNLPATENAKLKISSRVLSLAKRVLRKPDGDKS